MKVIPLTATPSQTVSVLLGEQNCQIKVEQKGDYMYMSLAINNVPLVNTMICRDRLLLVRYAYLGFVGNLAFIDTEGTADPVYTGLGARFILVYLP